MTRLVESKSQGAPWEGLRPPDGLFGASGHVSPAPRPHHSQQRSRRHMTLQQFDTAMYRAAIPWCYVTTTVEVEDVSKNKSKIHLFTNLIEKISC